MSRRIVSVGDDARDRRLGPVVETCQYTMMSASRWIIGRLPGDSHRERQPLAGRGGLVKRRHGEDEEPPEIRYRFIFRQSVLRETPSSFAVRVRLNALFSRARRMTSASASSRGR